MCRVKLDADRRGVPTADARQSSHVVAVVNSVATADVSCAAEFPQLVPRHGSELPSAALCLMGNKLPRLWAGTWHDGNRKAAFRGTQRSTVALRNHSVTWSSSIPNSVAEERPPPETKPSRPVVPRVPFHSMGLKTPPARWVPRCPYSSPAFHIGKPAAERIDLRCQRLVARLASVLRRRERDGFGETRNHPEGQ
jgi:hypothetical protein